MQTYQKFKQLNIDHAVIGLDQSDTDTKYFCTPEGATVVGYAGIAGIHYCFIEGFGDMVFAVSPEALPGQYVHPIARNFKELMELLLACGSMDAIEQIYMWDEELFEQYVTDNRPTENQKSVLEILRKSFHIKPMLEPYAYIKELQASFDDRELPFSDEYHQMMDSLEVQDKEEIKAPEWKVTYEGGFYPKRGRAGKEIRVDQTFSWGNEIWHIPAVYVCTKGLVVDYLMEVEPDQVKAFVKKWQMFEAKENLLSHEEQEQLQKEHPLNIEFRSVVSVNRIDIEYKQGCGVYWIPKECLPDDVETELEAKWILEYYGYNLEKAWAVHRVSYPWKEKKPKRIDSIDIRLERELTKVPCEPFVTPEVGKGHVIFNLITGQEHIFTVREYEEREMDPRHFQDESMEWPTQYAVMTYTIFPEMKDFYLQDRNRGDSPRPKKSNPHGPMASSIGFIGLRPKHDDSEEYYHPDGTVADLKIVTSSMYFERPKTIEWRLTLQEKRIPDISVKLI